MDRELGEHTSVRQLFLELILGILKNYFIVRMFGEISFI